MPRYTPQANGLAESINRPIKDILRIYKQFPMEFIVSEIHNFLNFGQHTKKKLSPL